MSTSNVLHSHQIGHDALEHLAFGFERLEVLRRGLSSSGAGAFGNVHALTQLEGVVVGDDDLGAVDVAQQVAGQDFAVRVIAVRIVGQENAEAVTDCDAGSDDQKAASEGLAVAGGEQR